MILVSGMDGQICEVCTEKAQEIINQELRTFLTFDELTRPQSFNMTMSFAVR